MKQYGEPNGLLYIVIYQNPFTQVRKERSKSLAVFGAFVSPKLGAAQLSFETGLSVTVFFL